MITSNKDLMTQARDALSGRWGLAIATFLVYVVIMIVLNGIPNEYTFLFILSFIFSLLLGGAFEFGIATFSLAIARQENANFKMLFSGFKYFGKTLGLYLLMTLFIFLWTLLLIIPGIIAVISYSLAFFIMSDNPSIGIMEAINKSEKMMFGYKWKFFILNLRFIGWIILCILSLGIGFLWIIPYISISCAKFYEDVKNNFIDNDNISGRDEK